MDNNHDYAVMSDADIEEHRAYWGIGSPMTSLKISMKHLPVGAKTTIGPAYWHHKPIAPDDLIRIFGEAMGQEMITDRKRSILTSEVRTDGMGDAMRAILERRQLLKALDETAQAGKFDGDPSHPVPVTPESRVIKEITTYSEMTWDNHPKNARVPSVDYSEVDRSHDIGRGLTTPVIYSDVGPGDHDGNVMVVVRVLKSKRKRGAGKGKEFVRVLRSIHGF